MTEEESSEEKENNKNKNIKSIELNLPNQIILYQDKEKNLIENYNFDYLFEEKSSQEEIYNFSSKEIINKILSGYNGAIICFGQTGMGKTYTINEIIDQIGKQIFEEIDSKYNVNNLYKVEVAGFEIFKEQINDTLDLINLNLNLKENKNKRIFVDNLTFFTVLDAEDFSEIIKKALFKRNNSSQSMKEYTSRCNNIIVVNIYHYIKEKKQLKTGCLYLVDLEGSEKMTKNKIEGESQEEKKILNKSLQSLRHLVQTLDQIKNEELTMSTYIPYRESKLTEILCDCFGGNCFTSMILNCCMSPLYFEETRNTLIFGQKVKNLQNRPKENIENNADKNPIVLEMLALYMESMKNKKQKEENKIVKKLEDEIAMLKKKIKELQEQIKKYLKQIEELKKKIKIHEENEKKFSELKLEHNALKNENCELKGNITLLEAKIAKYESEIEKLNSENEKLRKKEEIIKKLNGTIKELKNEIENLEKQGSENKKTINEQAKKIKAQEKEIKKQEEKIKALEESKEELNKEYSEYKTEAENKINDLDEDLKENKELLQKEKNNNKNLNEKLENLKKEIKEKDSQIKALEKSEKNNSKIINNLSLNNKKFKEKIDSLESI